MEKEETPLTYFHPASMAVCALYNDKRLVAFRNEERPLYSAITERSSVFASTSDILKRSGMKEIVKIPMYRIITVDGFNHSGYNIKVDVEDLQ